MERRAAGAGGIAGAGGLREPRRAGGVRGSGDPDGDASEASDGTAGSAGAGGGSDASDGADAGPDGPTGPNVCGDGWRDVLTEECDDGNSVATDACSITVASTTC